MKKINNLKIFWSRLVTFTLPIIFETELLKTRNSMQIVSILSFMNTSSPYLIMSLRENLTEISLNNFDL